VTGHLAPLRDPLASDGVRGFVGPDWDGLTGVGEDGEEEVRTDVDIDAIVASLREVGIKVLPSTDAGCVRRLVPD